MKTTSRLVLTAVFTAAILSFDGCLSSERFEPGYRPPSLSEINFYDPDTVVTVTGKVVEITGFEFEEGLPIVTLILEGEKQKRYLVQLGPAWFLKLKKASYREGDTLTVTGSLLTFPDEEEEEEEADDQESHLLLARKVKKGGHILLLRTKSGKPRWYRKGRMLGMEKNIGKRRDLRKKMIRETREK